MMTTTMPPPTLRKSTHAPGRRMLTLLALLALGCGGCASSDEEPTRYYRLSPVAAVALTGAVPRYELVIETVRLPDELDRAAMVLRQSATESRVMQRHRWLSPLSEQLTSVLISDLQSALPQAWVRPREAGAGRVERRYGLRLQVEQLALSADAEISLVATWTLVNGEGQVVRHDRASINLPAPASANATSMPLNADAIATSTSEAVARLAARVAEQVIQQTSADTPS